MKVAVRKMVARGADPVGHLTGRSWSWPGGVLVAGFSQYRRRAIRSRSAWMRGAWIAAAALTLIAAGCGGSGGLAGYMWTSEGSVVLVQWQVASSGRLHGTFTADVACCATPEDLRVSSSSTPFTGTISGGTVTLDFPARLRFFSGPAGPPPLARIHGTLGGGVLTLRILGATRGFKLTQAGIAAYNSAVSGLRSRVDRYDQLN